MPELHKTKTGKLVSVPPSDGGDDSLISQLEKLCREVASLDDAGLSVGHKKAIARAQKLRRRLEKGE